MNSEDEASHLRAIVVVSFYQFYKNTLADRSLFLSALYLNLARRPDDRLDATKSPSNGSQVFSVDQPWPGGERMGEEGGERRGE